MRIVMTESRAASPNGINVQLFRAGETYDVPEALGQLMLREKWATPAPAENKKKPAPSENKAR